LGKGHPERQQKLHDRPPTQCFPEPRDQRLQFNRRVLEEAQDRKTRFWSACVSLYFSFEFGRFSGAVASSST
jgi:hypothetical protein